MAKGNKRYLAKIKSIDTKNGPMQKIYVDNIDATNKDGSANTYHKGNLFWVDNETGKTYRIKQMGFSTPREGMKPELAAKGYVCFVTIDLEDTYETDIVE